MPFGFEDKATLEADKLPERISTRDKSESSQSLWLAPFEKEKSANFSNVPDL